MASDWRAVASRAVAAVAAATTITRAVAVSSLGRSHGGYRWSPQETLLQLASTLGQLLQDRSDHALPIFRQQPRNALLRLHGCVVNKLPCCGHGSFVPESRSHRRDRIESTMLPIVIVIFERVQAVDRTRYRSAKLPQFGYVLPHASQPNSMRKYLRQ